MQESWSSDAFRSVSLLSRKILNIYSIYGLQLFYGKQNSDADALSRAPVDQATTSDELGEGLPSCQGKIAMMSLSGNQLSQADPKLDPVLEKIKCAAAIDPVIMKLRNQIISGFPYDKCNLDIVLRPFWSLKERLAIDDTDNMIVMGRRVVSIPHSIRADILHDLVKMHKGATGYCEVG